MRNLRHTLLLSFIVVFIAPAQLVKQASFCRYNAEDVIDGENGISMYESLNSSLGGETLRYDEENQLVQGWVEDYYENGKVLHKGYYVDGKLKNYKNYFDNGQPERRYKNTLWNRSKMNTWYVTGEHKSKTAFYKSSPQKSEAFYKNGNLKDLQHKNRYAQFYTMTKTYYPNGKLKSVLKLTDKDSKTYDRLEYFANGMVKEQGIMKYDESDQVYLRDGEWKKFDTKGNLIAKQNFEKGKNKNGKEISW